MLTALPPACLGGHPVRILIDTDTAQADVATFSGWIDRDTGAACDVRLWDDDDVLAQLTAPEPAGYEAA